MLRVRYLRSIARTLRIHPLRVMSRNITLDLTPPKYTGLASPAAFNRKAFTKSFEILAARAPAAKISAILRAPEMKGFLLDIRKIASVNFDPQDPNCRLVLLNVGSQAELPEQTVNFLQTQAELKGFKPYTVTLDYDHWTADEIIHAVMPDHLKEGAPSGFAVVGHIAHLNLPSDYLPYKRLIGQIILDKNKMIRTVVNKLDIIDTVFRFFRMDLIAGEPNFVVEHNETDSLFTFDFREVYWNSRLHTEHARLVQLFSHDDVVADVFAGVGPFAVPAAKKGCGVFANDLNPNCKKYLAINVKNNGVQDLVRVSCEDGREFIRSVFRRSFQNPFPVLIGPRLSKSKMQRLQRAGLYHPSSVARAPPRRRISHLVMNLPETAITFLDAFRGVLMSEDIPELREVYDVMPMIHCYCFTRELEPEKAEVDIRQRVEETLGSPLTTEVNVHWVRSVAPNKEMYCISFRLPSEVAFASV